MEILRVYGQHLDINVFLCLSLKKINFFLFHEFLNIRMNLFEYESFRWQNYAECNPFFAASNVRSLSNSLMSST